MLNSTETENPPCGTLHQRSWYGQLASPSSESKLQIRDAISIRPFNFPTLAHQLTLHALHESLPELLLFSSLRRRTESDSTQSKESTACLAYLLFVQLISVDSFPAVFR